MKEVKYEKKKYQRKIISYTFFIVVITVLIGYLLQISFMNSFYYYRKKNEMLKISEKIKILHSEKKDMDLVDYIKEVKDVEGVQAHLILPGHELENQQGKNLVTSLYDLPNKDFQTITINQIRNTVLVYRETLDDGYTVFLRTSLSVISNYRNEMDIFNFITALLAIIITSVIGVIFSRKLTRDVEGLTKKTKKIAMLDFSDDIEFTKEVVNRDDEIGELANNIMVMSKNLYEAIEGLELFVGNASHELKTPIAVLTATLETLMRSNNLSDEERRKKYEILIVETKGLKELLEDLLLLSKIRSLGYNLETKELILKDTIEKSIGKFELLELEKDIEVKVNLKDEKILCDGRLFKIAIDNIIQNALKYSPFGGTLEIYVKDSSLFIKNSSEEEIKNIDRLFEPFIRGVEENSSIEGTGLGLSIIRKSLDINKIKYNISAQKEYFIFEILL